MVHENGKPALHVETLRAPCGMLESALSWHDKFQKDPEEEGFVFNACDPCVANEMVKGSQMTIEFHVDDLVSSHKDPTVDDEFLKFSNKKCGQHAEVKATRGDRHDCLGVTFAFDDGKLEVDMAEHPDSVLEVFR